MLPYNAEDPILLYRPKRLWPDVGRWHPVSSQPMTDIHKDKGWAEVTLSRCWPMTLITWGLPIAPMTSGQPMEEFQPQA